MCLNTFNQNIKTLSSKNIRYGSTFDWNLTQLTYLKIGEKNAESLSALQEMEIFQVKVNSKNLCKT